MSYMNTCATAIVGTWVERPNVCRTESVSMCRSLFGTEPVRKENNQNAKVNRLIPYLIVTQQLEIICYITKKYTYHYKDNQFFSLSKADFDFYLSVLELIFINLRKSKLCEQKEFVCKKRFL